MLNDPSELLAILLLPFRYAPRTEEDGCTSILNLYFNLIDELTVYENIELPLKYLGLGKEERMERVYAIMKKVSITHRQDHFPQQLSGGQQQRVAIARAMVSRPKLILADEPTGNLDSKNGTDVMNLLKSLNEEGSTIVMVTHSRKDAAYANRIINLFDGKIVDEDNNEF